MTDEWLFGTVWVHAFEEDAGGRAVFRPEDADFPLSRRPRERFTLEPDGSARLLMPGPDDRFIEVPGNWREEGGALVVESTGAAADVRVEEKSPDRLAVRFVRHP